ncbi:MAG: hypothetical protein KAW56_10880 [Candidatus Marinimicrobia bacterium]|nr:hypothetical protein [Candidatus Neomarinimicrobiota bacterium]
MTKTSIEILNAIVNFNSINNNYDGRLVIIEPKEAITDRGSKPGVFISFDNLTSDDFFEVYRYKRSLERENKGR